MRDFAKVAPTFWTGETGKLIRAHGTETQLLALYLMTNPHANMFGLYYLPLPLIEHETGLNKKKIITAFSRLQSIGFANFDNSSEFVWVVEMASYQTGEIKLEDNRIRGLQRAWEALPSNPFMDPFFEKYGERYGLGGNNDANNKPSGRACQGLGKGLPRASGPFGESAKPPLSPQIIEKEKETEREGLPPPITTKAFLKPSLTALEAYCQQRGSAVDCQKFMDHYESNGWRVGRNPMKDWRAAFRNWERSNYSSASPTPTASPLKSWEERAIAQIAGRS